MPRQIYTVELDGMQYDIEGDRPPTEQDVRGMIGGQVQAPVAKTPQKSLAQKAFTPMMSAETVKSRAIPSAISTAIPIMEAVSGLPRQTPMTIGGLREEGAQAVSAQTSPAAIIANLIAGAGAAKGAMPKVASILERGAPTASRIAKAEKLTTELMQPPKAEMTSYLKRGMKVPAVEETARIIKASKTYKDLGKNIDDAIAKIFNFRNKILKENNRPIGDYTVRLKKFIDTEKKAGQVTESELSQMKGVLARENEFLKNNKLDRLSGQKRKEYLEDLTENFLTKTAKGDVIDTQPARTRALNEIRRGLREEVEGNNYKIAELNSRYSGLKQARKHIAGQEALSQKAIPENILERVVRYVTRPKESAIGALNRQSSLYAKTKKISSLMRGKTKSGLDWKILP